MTNRKGFILLVTLSFLAALVLVALSILNTSCSEIIQVMVSDDNARAHYCAVSGAELLYNRLKSMEGDTVLWPQSVPVADSQVRTRSVGGLTVGTFSASANTMSSDVFGIASTGNVNGRTSTVTVQYGFDSPYTNGYPIACGGAMSLAGTKLLGLRSWVRAEGPLASSSTVTRNNLVKVSGDILENQAFVTPTFWWKYDVATDSWTSKTVGDSNGDTQVLTDFNEDGLVTIADAGGDEALEAIFTADDVNSDGVLSDSDGFYSYYTIELNKMGLGIAPGESGFYSGDQNFGPWSVPADTPIIFVDGNVDIIFNDSEWWGGESNHTIVATGDVNIIQPTNGSDDTLTIISGGDVNTGGIRSGGGVTGNLVIYASGDFNAFYGGRTNGTIFAAGNVDVDTVLPIPGLLNRDLNRSKEDWADPSDMPLGLPQEYNIISLSFRIKNEAAQFVPIWNRE